MVELIGGKMKNKKIISSDLEKYNKYRKLELISFIIIALGIICAALSAIFKNKGGTNHIIFITLIIIGLLIMISGFIMFSIYYFKIKKEVENENN